MSLSIIFREYFLEFLNIPKFNSSIFPKLKFEKIVLYTFTKRAVSDIYIAKLVFLVKSGGKESSNESSNTFSLRGLRLESVANCPRMFVYTSP